MTNKVTSEDIKSLIEIFDKSEWRDLALRVEDFKIFLSRDSNADWPVWLGSASGQTATARPATNSAIAEPQTNVAPQASNPPVPAPASTPKEMPVPEGAVVVRAPNLGIFYRSPKPGAAPYVQIGDEVEEDTEICLIEVMKLFTPVSAGMKGKVCQVCIEDGDLVEHDQPLFYIEPTE